MFDLVIMFTEYVYDSYAYNIQYNRSKAKSFFHQRIFSQYTTVKLSCFAEVIQKKDKVGKAYLFIIIQIKCRIPIGRTGRRPEHI